MKLTMISVRIMLLQKNIAYLCDCAPLSAVMTVQILAYLLSAISATTSFQQEPQEGCNLYMVSGWSERQPSQRLCVHPSYCIPQSKLAQRLSVRSLPSNIISHSLWQGLHQLSFARPLTPPRMRPAQQLMQSLCAPPLLITSTKQAHLKTLQQQFAELWYPFRGCASCESVRCRPIISMCAYHGGSAEALLRGSA